MALQIEKATDVQREFFRGLREKQRNPGEVLDWYYDEKIPVEAGDLVTFPQGFHCQWEILEPLRVVGKATK